MTEREQPQFNPEQQPPPKRVEKDDDLSFGCEYCMDRPGGCAQCGWGRRKKKHD